MKSAQLSAASLRDAISQGESAFIEFKSSVQAETVQGWINQCKQITSPRVIPDIELIQIENKTVAIVSIGDYRSANDGSGVRRVIDSFVAYGLPEPEFETTQGGMSVTVFKTPAEKNASAQPESQPESGLSLEAKVLQLLAKATMGKREISAALGQNEISGQLNKVVRTLLAVGLIETTIPAKVNSRLQQYRLKAQQKNTLNQPAGPMPSGGRTASLT